MAVDPALDRPRPWLRHYPQGVPPHLDVPNVSLVDLLAESRRRWGERAALIYYGAHWSYHRLEEESERFAAALRREGIGPGDRVALYLPNCPAYPIALFGILRVGAIATQVSPLFLGHDLVRLVQDAAPKAIVTLEILYPNLAKVAGELAVPVAFVARMREFYPLRTRPFVNLVLRRHGMSTHMPRGPEVRRWRRAMRPPDRSPVVAIDPATTVAVLQYTGGTTGLPKAAMLTHRNLVTNIAQVHAWNTTRDPGHETILACIPFFHVYGLTVALLQGLADGATIVVQTRPEVRELLRLIDRYRPTQLPGIPALYLGLLKQPDLGRFHLRSIKFCLSGSAPLPVEVQREFESLTGASVIEGYGLSETSPVTHANPVRGERRAGSVGLPVPDTEERLVHPETGVPLSDPNEVGELAVRGPQVMQGYYRHPEETAAVLQDGWFLTGDLARIDADGYAYIVDRKKDMINVGGFKVYPRQVEEVLFQHGAVADAAVVGVADPELGEVPVAFVVRKPGAAVTEGELVAFLRERIAHYKVPRRVEFRESLPRSGVQKVLRRVLREAVAPSIGATAPRP